MFEKSLHNVRSSLGRFRPSAGMLGISCWVAWVTVMYTGDTFVGDSSQAYAHSSAAFIVSTLALGASLMTMAVCSDRFEKWATSNRAVVCAAVLGSVSSVGLSLLGGSSVGLLVAFAFCTGLGTSVVALRSAALLSELDTKTALIAGCHCLVQGLLLYAFESMLYGYFSSIASLIILALLLPVSAFAFVLDEGSSLSREIEPSSLPRSFSKFAPCIAILAFALCSVRGYYPAQTGIDAFPATRAVVAVALTVSGSALALLAASLPRDASFGRLCYSLLLAITAAVVVIPALGPQSAAGGIVGSVLFGLSFVLDWVLLGRVVHHSGASVLKVFGFGFGAAALGSSAGFVVGSVFGELGGQAQVAVASLVVLALCLFSVLVLLRNNDLVLIAQPVETEGCDSDVALETRALGVPAESKARFRTRCNVIAATYSLSPRETEVFALLAKGKDAKAVAEELFVSFNTARTHIRNIYSKLGVHSRHELLDLVDGAFITERDAGENNEAVEKESARPSEKRSSPR